MEIKLNAPDKEKYENPQHNLQVETFRHIICLPFHIEDKSGAVGDNSGISLVKIKEALDSSGVWKQFHKLTAESEDDPENLLEKIRNKARKYQARAYFHPFVQRFLYDENRLLRYRRDQQLSLRIQLIDGNFGSEKIDSLVLEIERCELSVFMPNIGILMLKIKNDQGLPLKITQKILDELRRIYPPYFEERDNVDYSKTPSLKDIDHNKNVEAQISSGALTLWKSGHCPLSVQLMINNDELNSGNTSVFYSLNEVNAPSDLINKNAEYFKNGTNDGLVHPWEAHWSTLLQPFSTDINAQGLVIHQFGDDRAATMSYLAIDQLKLINRGNWVRLCFSDAPGNDKLPYAATFLKNFEEQYCYDRYWYEGEDVDGTDSPSRILNCGYSFSYIGSKKCRYFTNDNNGALATFNHIYSDMGMIAHFQRAALLSFSQRLSELVTRDNSGQIILPDNDKVQDMYRQFIEFTQNYWFDEISPQEQGQQLFAMWRKHLRIQELYDEVRQELKDLVDYLELIEGKRAALASGQSTKSANQLNNLIFSFGFVGFIVALISMFAGLFGTNGFDSVNWFVIDLLVIIFIVVVCVFQYKYRLFSTIYSSFKDFMKRLNHE